MDSERWWDHRGILHFSSLHKLNSYSISLVQLKVYLSSLNI